MEITLTDIVVQLRRERETDYLAMKAADEIERLREHVDALRLVATANEPEALRHQAEIARLIKENEKLKAKLREIGHDKC